MSYVGNVPTTAAFPFDQFSGNGSTTAFTLSYAPAGSTSIIVSISGVVQNPNTYSVSGTTLTFTPAPPTGTNNIAVLYLGLPVVATLTPGNTAYFSQSVFTATASQTVFTPSGTYQVGFINVIRNGSQLAPADYTATNGTTVTLANPCTAGDTVVIEVFNLTSISGALPLTGGTVTGATTFNSTVSVNGANVSGFTGFKNRIINPGMGIWQRGTSFAGLASSSTAATYTADRFACNRGNGSTGVVTVSQSSDVPSGTGLPYSLLVTVTATAASMNSTEYNAINQVVEGFNIADLGYGTANAATSILSFWAKASVTGTYCGTLIQRGAATQRAYPFTYVVSAANTWVQYFITVTGDTSGTLPYSNAAALEIDWYYGIGSSYASGVVNTWNTNTSANQYVSTTGVNMLATNGATLRITGVQLERGSNATSFEFRSIGQELQLCQRYFITSYDGSAVGTATTTNSIFWRSFGDSNTVTQSYGVYFKQTMRATPTVTVYSTGTGATGQIRDTSDNVDIGAVTLGDATDRTTIATNAAGLTANQSARCHYTASAEL